MQFECGSCGFVGELDEASNPVCPECGSPDLSRVQLEDEDSDGEFPDDFKTL